MKNIAKCLSEINKTNSLKSKEAILKKYDSPEVRSYLDIALNPYRIFYVNKLPKRAINKKIELQKSNPSDKWFFEPSSFTKFEALAKQLEQRKISGHNALHTTRKVLGEFESEISNWLEKAILRKSIGVGIKTVNKVYGNHIPEFGVMLADNKQADFDSVKFPTIVQPKLDGFRAVYIPSLGFIGRNGKALRNKGLKGYFRELYTINDYVMDGEIYSDKLSFNELSSVLNSEEKEIPYSVKFIAFDGMPYTQWRDRNCTLGYKSRLRALKATLDSHYAHNLKIISSLTLKKNILEEAFNMYLKKGYEGMMVKDPEGMYQWKRVSVNSGIMMKVKPVITEDVEITGFVEGEGKFEGMLGKFMVDFNGVQVGVGTGYSEEQRKKFWKNRKKMIGKVIEVKGMEVTIDKSIRHPVFLRIREDK